MQYTSLIVTGKGRGQRIVGYPTFNLAVPPGFTAENGVYSCTVWLEGKKYAGALHYGAAPTFDDPDQTLEIFLLDYTPAPKDDKPTELTFELGTRLRPVATFLSPQELHDQIAKDIIRIRRITNPA